VALFCWKISSFGKKSPTLTTNAYLGALFTHGDRKPTARDIRGFAVKLYTDEGNWDLVGSSIPVFFIQVALKFPDLIHAVKPERHNGMPVRVRILDFGRHCRLYFSSRRHAAQPCL
jgi:hypothetical protein